MPRFSSLIAGSSLVLAVSALGPACPQVQAAPPTEPDRQGRYIMQPVDGGVLRMDSESGAMSLCVKRGSALTCEPVQDDRTGQKEAERLALENRELKADIKRLEEQLGLGDKPHARAPVDGAPTDGGRPDAGRPDEGRSVNRGNKFELPSEEDVDKALTYVERMLKKFRDKWKDIEGHSGSKGTPL